MPVPPQARRDAHGQFARLVEGAVRLEDVRRHPRVLPSGDPEGVEVLLCHEQGSTPFGRIGPRDEPVPEGVRRALVQRAGRLAGHGVAFDTAVPRVGRLARDPGELERAAVHPRAVHVPVHQEHRAIGDDAVQVLLARGSAGEQVHGPAASGDPGLAGVGAGVRGDGFQVGLDRPEMVEVHAQQVPSAERGVDVRVLEAGHDQAPGHRPHVGRGVGEIPQLSRRPEGDDPAVLHRHRSCTGLEGPAGQEGGVRDDQVGCPVHGGAEPTGAGRSGRNPYGAPPEIRLLRPIHAWGERKE